MIKFRRLFVSLIGLLLQLSLQMFIYLYLESYLHIVGVIYFTLGLLIVLSLIKNSKNYSFDLPWIIIILLFPLVGGLMYRIIKTNKEKSVRLKSIRKSEIDSKKYLVQDKSIRKKIEDNGNLKYITDYASFPVTTNNDVDYYSLGEYGYTEVIKELKKAKEFIFLEYFIIKKGKMWDSILDILKEKAKEGIDVRVIYDDFGCLTSLDKYYYKYLESLNIKCISFNKLKPIGGVFMNNRDHRKILVIDGKVAFSGGINLADEYINEEVRFGQWKDNVIKVKGDAVFSYTVMFLSMWNAYRKDDDNYLKFKRNFDKSDKGFLAPYSETPLDNDVTGENIYLNIINSAKKYVYIMTPYLIIDTDMIKALELASKKGVDIRIVIPNIPDKKLVYLVTESYARTLISHNVKIYKYKPGFVHSKVFVSDDKIATVGTLNMDYRSLYLHFECGLYMENVKTIKDIKKDMLDTIDKSHLVKTEKEKVGFFRNLFESLIRLIAPLL
ncbi:MAG: cardiolipin synthase [Bacilli bacterium]|nr:cardiolipin synthase [Bacilli bacterium]